MRWGPKAITALLALACGGGGGHDNVIITTRSSFPQGFLPVLLGGSSGRGDVSFRVDGDLYAVAGTSDVTVVLRANGEHKTFANDVGSAQTPPVDPNLLSITPGFGEDARLFAGDDAGRIWVISGNGSTASLYVDTGSEPITGLMFAPTGFGEFGGQLFAAAGTSGILRITISDSPIVFTLADPGDRFVDLVFSGTTLFAIKAVDATHAEIDTVSSSGTVATLQGGFVAPVGIAADSTASEIYVADAGDDLLYTVPFSGGAPTARAAYHFDSAAPSGLAYDGLGAIAFLTSSPLAIRGSNLPRIDPANANFGRIFSGPTVGYGDLELDRAGAFVMVANDDDDPGISGDSINNFLFSVARDASVATTLSSGVGPPSTPIEELLGVAVNPFDQAIYVSTRSGNVWKRDTTGAVSLVVSVSASAVLGLELVPLKRFDPFAFDPYGSDPSDPLHVEVNLAATTSDGHVFVIDVTSETKTKITTTPIGSRLSDLVFSSDGTLWVVDNGTTTSRILRVAPNGTATDLGVPTAQLGRPDGIEIDEGANRLLVTSQTAAGDQLLAIDLGSGAVTALEDISIDDGFFPTGIVYDRLGTAVLRKGNNSTALDAVDVRP